MADAAFSRFRREDGELPNADTVMKWATRAKQQHKDAQKFVKTTNKKHFDALTMFDGMVLEDQKGDQHKLNMIMAEDHKNVKTGLSYADVAFLDAWEDEINWNRHEALMTNVEYFVQKDRLASEENRKLNIIEREKYE